MKQSFYGRIYSQSYDLEGRRGDMLPLHALLADFRTKMRDRYVQKLLDSRSQKSMAAKGIFFHQYFRAGYRDGVLYADSAVCTT